MDMTLAQLQMQQLMEAFCATENKIAVTSNKRHVVIGMEANEKLIGAGMVHLRVFQGSVETLGFGMPPGIYYDLYSPRWSNLMGIRACENEFQYQALCSSLTQKRWAMTHSTDQLILEDEAAADTLAKEIASKFPTVLIFRAMEVTYGNLSSYFDGNTVSTDVILPGFRFIRHKDTTAPTQPKSKAKRAKAANDNNYDSTSSTFTSISSIEPHPTKELLFPATWLTAAVEIKLDTSNRKALVCGAKGVGKSTFSRFLVNRLLKTHRIVAYLDTDVGQPELAAPGVLSLHYLATPLLGPGYTHLEPAYRSYFFGFSSPKADPTQYMAIITTLLDAYMANDPTIPLVINTDGWIKSMGYDLLHSTLMATNPSHVVQIVAMSKAKSFDVPLSSEWKLHPIEIWDADPPQPARSSKELRQFRLHAYFLAHIKLPTTISLTNLHCTSEQTRYGRLMSTVYPMLIPYRVPFQQVGIRVSGASVPPSQVLHVLNGSIVGLCIHKHDVKLVGNGPCIVLDNPMAPCVGHGIVRSIDVERQEFHVLSSIPVEILKHVNLFVRGHISIAFQLLDQSAVYGHTPYAIVDVLASEGTGASLMESRNNLKRKKEISSRI